MSALPANKSLTKTLPRLPIHFAQILSRDPLVIKIIHAKPRLLLACDFLFFPSIRKQLGNGGFVTTQVCCFIREMLYMAWNNSCTSYQLGTQYASHYLSAYSNPFD